jgi:Mlc titration factor MtfA (ptsG expression regulator)
MSIWDIISRTGQDFLKSAIDKLQFRLPTDPVPEAWHDILARNVPLARGLSADEKEHLLRVARLLLDEVPFEAVGDLKLTDEIRVTIAATASLLVHRLPYPRFMKLVRVLVYPDTFVPKKAESRHDAIVIETDPSLGEAWMDGVVLLSWESVRRDAEHEHRTGSVVLHEMAHILDAEDGRFDGTPIFDESTQGAEWSRVLTDEFGLQEDAVTAGDDPPLDAYAATNHAEFFAVATETFFCAPDRLRARLPALYEQLRRFYRV